jgi:hypothetical protein
MGAPDRPSITALENAKHETAFLTEPPVAGEFIGPEIGPFGLTG